MSFYQLKDTGMVFVCLFICLSQDNFAISLKKQSDSLITIFKYQTLDIEFLVIRLALYSQYKSCINCSLSKYGI